MTKIIEPVQEKRAKRFQAILNLIRNNDGISYLKLVGLLCVNFGLSTRAAKDHIKILRQAEFIMVADGKVFINEYKRGSDEKTNKGK